MTIECDTWNIATSKEYFQGCLYTSRSVLLSDQFEGKCCCIEGLHACKKVLQGLTPSHSPPYAHSSEQQ